MKPFVLIISSRRSDLSLLLLDLAKVVEDGTHDLFQAIINSRPELALLKHETYNKTLLHVACEVGCKTCVKVLLEHGCDSTEKDSNGWASIHYAAAWNRRPYVVELLLKHNPSLLNATTDKNSTSLHWAAYYSHYQTVILLLKQELIDVTVRDWLGRTPDECTTDDIIMRKIQGHGSKM